jgi:OmpA-OmpF porin, OOP family
MHTLSKFAVIVTTALIAASATAQSVPASRQAVNDNWVAGEGDSTWTNGTGELCWRDALWTPATANTNCDGAMLEKSTGPTPVNQPTRAPLLPDAYHKIYQADTLFNFDTSVLKSAGKAALDELASKLAEVKVEIVVATGYTDRIGSDRYNDRLSLRRAQAVRAYLASRGVDAKRIFSEGKGKRDPVTRNSCNQRNREQLIACLAPDRRVQIEVAHALRQP